MGPIDYLSQLPQPDITKDIAGGLQLGAGIRAIQQQQQSQQLAQQQAQQYAQDVQAAMASPTPQNFSALALKYPTQREAVKQAWDSLSTADQKAEGDTMAQAYAAILAGKPDVAKQVVQAQIDARKNSGIDTSHYDNALSLLDTDPKQAQGALGFALAHIMDPKNYAQQFGATQGEQRTADAAPADLAKKQADARSAQADAAEKNLGIVGQTLGALQSKGAKPAQVQTALNALVARGVISKDELPGYLASVPTDPKQLDDWLGSMKLAGMKPSEQMKYTTPTADAKLQSDTSIRTTGMNNATSLAVAKENSSAGDKDASLDQDTLTAMAQQYLAGDKSVMQNLGRGTQGAANIVALRQEITKQAKAQGMSGAQIAATMADYVGTLAGQRTAGTRIANVEMASDEAQRLIPLAKQASADVARSGFLPFGKAQNMFDDQTNDPALRKFAAANNALVNVYSRAISPGGVATVSDKEHARHMLSTAMDHQSYLAVLDQMQREIQAAREAPQAVRGAFRDRVTSSATTAVPALPSGWSVEVH